MQISKGDVICGLPAETARRLMREYYTDVYPVAVAAEVLDIDFEAARSMLCEFETAGYLERIETQHVIGEEQWTTTVLGNALAQASFGKRISRATASRHLREVVERARRYNADPRYLLTISEIRIFGSYLDPDVDRLGDLDLALTVVRRASDGERFVERVVEYARASGRRFDTYLQQLYWPSRELLMILKNRSPAIKITREDISKLTSRFEIVYAVADDPGAIQPPPDAMLDG